jgi:ATP-binding cassette subfamily B (MDR/TAP) protein 8
MVLATLYMGGYLVSSNQVLPGEIMSFLVAIQTIQRSLTQLSLLFGQMVKGLGAGARVFEVSVISWMWMDIVYRNR